MKKVMQHLLSRQLLLAAISSALILCSCSKENIYAPAKSGAIREVTLKAGITSGTTKVGFEDKNSEGVKLTWEANDQLTLFKADGTQAGTLTLSLGSGSSSGTFTGTITANPGDELTIAYPPAADANVTKNQYDIAKGATLSIQTQEGNSTTAHLKNAAFMDATATLGEGSVLPAATLTNRQALLTVRALKPADWSSSDGDPSQLRVTISGTSYTLNLSNAKSWSTGSDLVAWLAIVPDNSSSKKVSVQVVMPGTGDLYEQDATSSKVYGAGTRYTATLSSLGRNSGAFSFTVQTDAPGASSPTTMVLPFDGSVPAGTSLTVDWGDADATCNYGTTNRGVTTLTEGTNLTDLTGTYLAAGTHTIKISSSAPVTQQQMPAFNRLPYSDKAKFITLNSPMLNTGSQNLNFYFSRCTNLTTIPATLFINNTEAISFGGTFSGCISLTTIPAGLFSGNLKAYSFYRCFESCTKARIEGDPFINGTTTTKENRFAAITGSINFSSCFSAVASDPSVTDKGNAPELWDYTYNSGVSISSGDNFLLIFCFSNTSFANDGSIPNTGWHTDYTMATTGKIPADALNWKGR